MVKKKYSVDLDGAKTARAMLVNAPISTKWAVEVASAIRGMPLLKAEEYLKRVLDHKDWIPQKRYHKDTPHRKGVRAGIKSGRYMDKTVKYYLKLIENVKNNAQQKGLDVSKLRIVHVSASKGYRRPRVQPMLRRIIRKKSTHVEMVVSE
ncbi:MAG: 50S ribosomal protein L22 [Candidatus Diapherotrites archaeon]|nr:50S ribosomal protein L22 [Candidatus Diapherotrites archaeon]